MNRKLLALVVSTAISLAGVTGSGQAQEVECDGVLMQSRLALANCMVESAVAIAAAVVKEEGCAVESWQVSALVDEYYLSTMPIQGSLVVQGGANGDFVLLNGKVAAVFNPAKNNVLCQVSSEDIENTLYGVPFTYSGGKDNLYPEAVIDKDEALVCIRDFSSAGNITIEAPPKPRLQELDSLTFSGDSTNVQAIGDLTISERRGNSTSSENWGLVQSIYVPPENEGAADAFLLTASRLEGDCTIEVRGAIYNGADESPFWLTMDGTMSVQ